MRLLFAFTILALAPSPVETNKRKEHKQQVRRHDDVESTTSSIEAAFSTTIAAL
jgi:hypothetical protein